jgi:hypothetical protein
MFAYIDCLIEIMSVHDVRVQVCCMFYECVVHWKPMSQNLFTYRFNVCVLFVNQFCLNDVAIDAYVHRFVCILFKYYIAYIVSYIARVHVCFNLLMLTFIVNVSFIFVYMFRSISMWSVMFMFIVIIVDIWF